MTPRVIVDGEFIDIEIALADDSVFCFSLNDDELELLLYKLIKARVVDRTERREVE